jgi:Ca-activated chloride channel family protein
MLGIRFEKLIANNKKQSVFEQLLSLFLEIMVHTSGDVDETFKWLKYIDEENKITTPDYTLEDFKKDLEENGYLTKNPNGKGNKLSSKSEQIIRKRSLDQVFGKLKKSPGGNHASSKIGKGEEVLPEQRAYEYGDSFNQIDFNQSIKNSQIRSGLENFDLQAQDMMVNETEHLTSLSTVLMIDISHSMILYGEDRITPAKKVAMALVELIKSKYPKDHIDVIVFGNDAWQIPIKDLPYLQVGPYHTNTVAGLELAMDLLRKRKTGNKQIFMITDGKPTCLKLPDGRYYKNSNGLDPEVLNKTINLAMQCRKLKIPITTFMIAQDFYLREFVDEFTRANNGKAFYAGLDNLGDFIFSDYELNKNKKRR